MTNDKCRVIGLTGPIGAGKTEAAKILRRMGACVISADEIGHKLLEPQTEAWGRIVHEFGSAVLQSGGKINRKKLAEVVFSDPKRLKILNSITRPYIFERIRESCKLLVVSCKLVVIDAALPRLFEGLVDETWVIIAPKEKRVKRLLKSGLAREQINKRMKSQLIPKKYLSLADKVVKNDRTLKGLKAQITKAARGLV